VNRAVEWDNDVDHAAPILSRAMSERRFDDAAFDRLTGWLPRAGNPQRGSAIAILFKIQADDPRVPAALAALAAELDAEQDSRLAGFAVEAISRLAASASLSERARDSLLNAASRNPDGAVRIAAAETLIAAGAGSRSDALSVALAAEMNPEGRLARTDSVGNDPRSIRKRAADALVQLHDPPYPTHVIDAWIGVFPDSLESLRQVRAAGQLSETQVGMLEQRAASAMSDRYRFDQAYAIYDFLLTGMDLGGQADSLVADLSATDPASRYRAAFRLREIARRDGVTAAVAAAARRAVLDDDNPLGIRALAAQILLLGATPGEDPAPTLITALRDSKDSAAIEFLGPELIESLRSRPDGRDILIGYASDRSLDGNARAWLISNGMVRRQAGEKLSPYLERRLQSLATEDADRYVRMSAANALAANGYRKPLKSRIESGELPHQLMFYAFFTMLIAFPVMLVAGILRFRRWTLMAWIVFSIWLLMCFGLAFLGMMGHNSLPPWRQTWQASLPLYASFSVYAIWFIGHVAATRQRRNVEVSVVPQ